MFRTMRSAAAGAAMAMLAMVLALGTTTRLTAAEESPAAWRWEYEPGERLALIGQHGPLWQLNFKKEEGKPYFHPLCTPDGTLLSWHRPSDHPWHRALWFSWKLINGRNYWEPDAKTGKLQGLSDVVDVKISQMDPHGATVVMRVDYHPPEQPAVLEEIRTLTITVPDGDGSYRIDWQQSFTAVGQQDVVLDRTPPKKTPWGGYGGLSYRAAQSMTDVVLLDSEGRRNKEIHGRKARWVDAGGLFGAEKKSAAGVTIFGHPSNPRHPTPWYVAYEPKPGHPFVYTNPALLFHEPLTLPAGESLLLRYRVLIHRGPADADQLDGEFQRFATAASVVADERDRRPSLWVDVIQGEPASYGQVLADLASVGVIYLGESHRLERHHNIQAQIVRDLGKQGVQLVLGIEQLDASQQPVLQKYNRGEIDFDQLAKETGWAQRWSNYEDYRPILEAARGADAPVIALNARSETIRQIARGGGIAKLDPQLRKELPAEIQTKDPPYEKLLNVYMMVHASLTAERLRPIVEAQIARDETMASELCSFLKSPEGRGRTAVVICGSGHVEYGLGTPSRVRRRLPDVKDRIILLSQSGDVELTPAEKAMSREIVVTHEQLRALNRPVADYLHVTGLK